MRQQLFDGPEKQTPLHKQMKPDQRASFQLVHTISPTLYPYGHLHRSSTDSLPGDPLYSKMSNFQWRRRAAWGDVSARPSTMSQPCFEKETAENEKLLWRPLMRTSPRQCVPPVPLSHPCRRPIHFSRDPHPMVLIFVRLAAGTEANTHPHVVALAGFYPVPALCPRNSSFLRLSQSFFLLSSYNISMA